MPYPHLLAPYERGDFSLSHRVAMAPMTRNRAGHALVPTALNAEYYAQRADASLIITEATVVAPEAQGYHDIPGLFNDAQEDGWARVIAAVRAAGDAKLVVQLFHCGRVAHPVFTGTTPLAPSAVPATNKLHTLDGEVDYVVPREMTLDEIAEAQNQFVAAARRAIAAGADGVELHGAAGYLIQQFLSVNANQRSDRYGGSIENRIRFVVELVDAVADAIGDRRTALRVSPGMPFNTIEEGDSLALYEALLAALAHRDLMYLHVMEVPGIGFDSVALARRLWHGSLGVNPASSMAGFIAHDGTGEGLSDREEMSMVDRRVADGQFDFAIWGRRFLANPDLVTRMRRDAELNVPDVDTFYTSGARGYVDYPMLDAAALR
jgi:N-ethylmaleimide reductase